jgi:hypothetical protein
MTPFTPQSLIRGSTVSRSAAVSSAVQCSHSTMSTPLARAYRVSSGTHAALHPSSTSTYGHPLRAAKSTYAFCRSKSLGLEFSLSHDHATLPGLTHDVSATFDGGAKSSTSVEPVTVARSPTIAVRHGVRSSPSEVTCSPASTTWYVPEPAACRSFEPGYRPSTSDSVSSA